MPLKQLYTFILLFLLYACAEIPQKPAYELLGGRADSKVFLACNLWFTETKLIPVENYPKGRLLNVGTEIKIISYNEKEIKFSNIYGSVFTIIYKKERTMMPVEKYINLIFSLTNPLESIDENSRKAILMGEIKQDMKKEEIFMALGPPIMTRTGRKIIHGHIGQISINIKN